MMRSNLFLFVFFLGSNSGNNSGNDGGNRILIRELQLRGGAGRFPVKDSCHGVFQLIFLVRKMII